jgi:hypothetical protein
MTQIDIPASARTFTIPWVEPQPKTKWLTLVFVLSPMDAKIIPVVLNIAEHGLPVARVLTLACACCVQAVRTLPVDVW